MGTDGTIYVGATGPSIYAINPNGTQKWAFDAGCSGPRCLAIGPDGTIYGSMPVNNLYAINPNGTKKWTLRNNMEDYWYCEYSVPAVGADGTIYVGWPDGNLYAVNPNGTKKWVFKTESWVRGSPTIGSDGTIYVVNDTDKLYALNANGTQKWAYYSGASGYQMSPPTLGPDGTIYVSHGNGYGLYAIYSDSPGLANSSWPMAQHDAQHTGRVNTIPPKPKNSMSSINLLLLDN